VKDDTTQEVGAAMTLALKTKHTFHTEEEVHAARQRANHTDAGREYLGNLRNEVKHLLPLSWDELWDFAPPIDLLRTDYVNSDLLDRSAKSGEEAGCPIHGPEIFREKGNRSWILNPERPWQVQCPIGGEFYPTNDFGEYLAAGRREKLNTREKYVDDGTGYVDEQGRRYFFVGYYNHHCRWALEVIWAARVFGRLHLLTQDIEYARRGAILLLRVASVYPLANRGSQSYTPGGKGKLFTWYEEYYATVGPLAEAYDDLFGYMKGADDAEFFDFIHVKGVPYPCFFVEHNFIQNLFHTAALTEELVANPGYLEQAVSAGLAALGPTETESHVFNMAEKMTDFVLHGGHYQGLCGLLWGNVWHDGLPCSNLEYNTGIAKALLLTLDRLAVAGANLWGERRARLLADGIAAYSLGGMFSPSTGDGGGCSGESPFGRYAFRPGIRAAYRGLKDPRLARAFHVARERGPNPWKLPWLVSRAHGIRALEIELFDEDLEETSERPGTHTGTCFIEGTRHFPGYGVAFLESGARDSKRALSLTYGCSAGGHHHCDRLNIELAWKDRVLLPDLGYPEAWLDKYRKWSRNTISHYCTMVDGKTQDNTAQGSLLFLGDAGPVHALEAENPATYDVTRDYRRTTALVDIGKNVFYMFDVFRVAGGDTHHWSFHGPAAKCFSVSDVDVPEARKGSLMGEDVPFGALTEDTSGLQFLCNVRPLRPDGNFSVEWLHEKGTACVRATVLADGERTYFLCDGQPERRTCEAEWLQYILATRNGTDLRSAFGVVVDAWEEGASSAVRSIEKLDTDDKDIVAVRVVHAEGTDIIVSTGADDRQAVIGDISLSGRLGLVREKRNGETLLALFDGTSIRYKQHQLSPSLVQGEVLEIDLEANSVALSGRHENLGAGQVIVFSNNERKTSYTVTGIRVERERTWVSLREQIAALRGRTEYVEPGTGKLHTHMLATKYGTGMIHSGKFKPDLRNLYLATDNGKWTESIRDCHLCPLEKGTDPDFIPPDERHIQIAEGTELPACVSRPGSIFHVLEVAPGSTFRVPACVSAVASRGK